MLRNSGTGRPKRVAKMSRKSLDSVDHAQDNSRASVKMEPSQSLFQQIGVGNSQQSLGPPRCITQTPMPIANERCFEHLVDVAGLTKVAKVSGLAITTDCGDDVNAAVMLLGFRSDKVCVIYRHR